MKTLTPMRHRLGFETRDLFDPWLREVLADWPRSEGRFEMRYMPAANFAETEKSWVVTMELPGMNEKDVEVRLNGNELVVTGERREEKESKDRLYHRVESMYGKFERRFELPHEVALDPDKVDAQFHKGMLEIHVAKRDPKPVKKIPVKGD